MDSFFLQCRNSVFKADSKEFLLSKIASSDQEKDLSVPPNCEGYGRIRHFKRIIAGDWSLDPLPIDPACKSLGLPYQEQIEAEVFQIASCNLNCWYCFVPDALKRADHNISKWFSAVDMMELFNKEKNTIKVIDLSGGNPELVPEWILETMKALENINLSEKIYLWSDDTLTTDYTFRFLSKSELSFFKSYKNYGRVCCFKGYDQNSFTFNTHLPAAYFERQFDNFAKYLELGLDLYGYVTFTTNNIHDVQEKIFEFINRLKKYHPLLPLRIVPLKIIRFSPVQARINPIYEQSLDNQVIVNNEWRKQLETIYNQEILKTHICDIKLYN